MKITVMSNIVITCPKCGRIIFHYDQKATNAFEVKCRNCGQMSCIKTDNGTVQSVKPIKKAERESSCGKRFY